MGKANWKAWAAKHPERRQAINKKAKLFYRYGLTPASYEALLRRQRGKCAICRNERKLVIDHCHIRDVVRGLLCTPCNNGLGMFSDSPELLAKAMEYLRRTSL